jgi:hypothetical protein
MTRLVAIASKQVQLQELVACIDHFSIDDLRLHLFDHRGRIDGANVRSTIAEACPGTQLEMSTFDIGDRQAIRSIFDQTADVVAFSLYRSSAFYRRVPALRRRSTIVNITDGLGDLFSMWELQRAVLAKTSAGLAKGALVIPLLYALRTDIEFNLFHPKKTPYARRCHPVGPFPIAAKKREALGSLLRTRQPRALVIDGFDLTADRIAAQLDLGSYTATRRNGGIDIDGRLHLEDQVICAEEVLALMRPELVVGCPSTSLAAARSVYPDLPTYCITTPEALRVRGSRFNAIFRNHAERFGIVFATSDDVSVQLDQLGQLIPPNDHARAS